MDEVTTLIAEVLHAARFGPVGAAAGAPQALDAAVAIWAAVRQHFPRVQEAYQHAAQALQRHGRNDECHRLIQAAVMRFPDALWPLAQGGWLAVETNDSDIAIRYGARARGLFPDQQAGYINETAGLRQAGRVEEAEQVANLAATAFPGEAWPLETLAWLARDRNRWAQVADRAAAVRERFPQSKAGFMLAATASRQLGQFAEAAVTLATAQSMFSGEAWPWIDAAWLAHADNDVPRALSLWRELRQRFPDDVNGYTAAAVGHAGLGQLTEAEDLLREAAGRFPGHKQAIVEWARLAVGRGAWDEAEQRWCEARRRFPDDPEIATEHAGLPANVLMADGRRDWGKALERCAALNQDFATYAPGYTAHIDVLRRAGHLAQAEALAVETSRRFPWDVGVRLQLGRVCEATGNHSLAVASFQEHRDGFGADERIDVALAASLAALGRFAEADVVCEAGLAQSNGPDLYRQYARIASQRGDAAAATRRWAEIQRRFPGDLDVRSEAIAAEFALTEGDAPILADAAHDAAAASGGTELATLIMEFESLGGTAQGCEFGTVQRRLGAEPISLLRWSQITLRPLLDGLETNFEGVGTAEQTELGFYTHYKGDLEYKTSDKRFLMVMHTFIPKEMMPFDQMFKQSCRRLRFLKARFLESLAEGQKIFVFKTGDRTHSHAEVFELFRAIRRHGDGALLYVRQEEAGWPSGSVQRIEDGFMIGYLDRFSQSATGSPMAPNFVHWTDICRQASQMWQVARRRGAAHVPAADNKMPAHGL